MNDLVERLRDAARRACTRHNGIDQFDSTWQRKPKDFIEWEAADEIKRLEADAENLRNTITSMQLSLKEQANAQAMVRRATKLIEDLLPGIGHTTVNVGELNEWLLASRDYNASTPADRVRERRWSRDAMECPGCKEIELVPQIGSDEMWECMSCHCEVML